MKPIIFTSSSIQAILEDRKTMTRRIIKPQPDIDMDSGMVYFWKKKLAFDIHTWYGECNVAAKYFKGDILYVKETWRYTKDRTNEESSPKYEYKRHYYGVVNTGKWRSPWFMPKEAARIFLEVTDVGVERLLDIAEEDCLKEGIITNCLSNIGIGCDKIYNENDYPSDHFKILWESINGKDSWDKNPWVWVYSFKRIEKPE